MPAQDPPEPECNDTLFAHVATLKRYVRVAMIGGMPCDRGGCTARSVLVVMNPFDEGSAHLCARHVADTAEQCQRAEARLDAHLAAYLRGEP